MAALLSDEAIFGRYGESLSSALQREAQVDLFYEAMLIVLE
jgi:hypothetical protein